MALTATRPSGLRLSSINEDPLGTRKRIEAQFNDRRQMVDAGGTLPPPISKGYPEPEAAKPPADPFFNKFAGKVV